jgi:hypothetical protein
MFPPQALNEEKVAYDRSPSKNIYLNVAVNTLKKLRGLVPNTVPGLSSESGAGLCEGQAQSWGGHRLQVWGLKWGIQPWAQPDPRQKAPGSIGH